MYQENAEKMQRAVEDLELKIKQIKLGWSSSYLSSYCFVNTNQFFVGIGGGESARKRHLARNKLLPRDR